jgi:Asp/Glu/hydantoin racemase
MIATGGKAVAGASLGILMLDAQFPRIPGEVGNALTWDFPVHYKIVRGASPQRVVRERAVGLLEPFIEAGRELVIMGADGITTNCGFLSLFQAELAAALDVPVAASSLMQVPLVQALLPPGRRVGVLTISKASLTPDHLHGAGIPLETPVVGCDPDGEFARVIIGNELELDVEKARADMVLAAGEIRASVPDLGAIVLECTNMPPYAADVRQAAGVPVFGMDTFIRWFQGGLVPRRW